MSALVPCPQMLQNASLTRSAGSEHGPWEGQGKLWEVLLFGEPWLLNAKAQAARDYELRPCRQASLLPG